MTPAHAIQLYFLAAVGYNFSSARSESPYTLHSETPEAARASTLLLIAIAALEACCLAASLDGIFTLAFGAVFPAFLLADGVLLHCLVPYSRPVGVVLEQGKTAAARRVHFHPSAFRWGIAINAFGVLAHVACGLWCGGTRRSVGAFLACALALCHRRRTRAKSGAWEARDAAWYPQTPPYDPPYNLESASVPTLSMYITMSDGVKLAADIWLPDDQPKIRRPTVLHFTPYNRNWRVHPPGSNAKQPLH